MNIKIVTNEIERRINYLISIVLEIILSPISLIIFLLIIPIKRAYKTYNDMQKIINRPRLYKKRK